MTIFGIIPARGGSKGIPGKNIRVLRGKPLLAWSIEHARNTPQISRVFVSTDSPEIAAVARDHGAEVIQRPPDISGDTASSESCLVHALDYLQSAKGQGVSGKSEELSASPSALCPSPFALPPSPLASEPDLVVFLQATSPMLEPDDIQRAIETLQRENADSLFSAYRVEGFVWRFEKNGTVRSFTYNHKNRPRRQDAPVDLIENGSIYIFKPWVLRQFNNRLGGKIAVYRMPALDSFQIDEPADLELMEALMAYRRAEGGNLKPEKAATSKEPESSAFSSPVSSFRSQPLPLVAAPPGPSISAFSFQLSAFKAIRLLALDFDGVLTDNRVLVSEDGKEAVLCDRGDGLGIGMLKAAGVEVVVISKERNPVVAARCQKLGIEWIQACDAKLEALRQRAERQGLSATEIAFVGNDINDLECLRWAGLPIAVADADPQVKAAARWVTGKFGGRGAVREICDHILRAKETSAQDAKSET